MSGSIGLLAALLSLGMSVAPGWRELRWFAVCACLAALFIVSNVFATLRVEPSVVILGSRLSLFFGGLHVAAWFVYAAAQERRRLSARERVFVVGLVVVAAMMLVPGLMVGSTMFERDVPWLGVVYVDAAPTTLGVIGTGYYLIGLSTLCARFARMGTKKGGREIVAQAVALAVVVVGGGHDTLAALGVLSSPYLLDIAVFVLVLAVFGTLASRFVGSARELEASAKKLNAAHLELVKRERLAALGELSAVVAHEVRNPLAVVFNATAGLRKATPASKDYEALIDIVQEEAERLRDLVSDLLEFARPRPPVLVPAPLEDVLRGAVEAARSGAGAKEADVVVRLPAGIALAFDERFVRQAVVNLVSNALQAAERKGPVEVDVTRRDEHVVIRVRDDGKGVPEDLRERIFTPFFSTRPRGTGLGLAIVRRCADAHGGEAVFTVTPGGGATFELSLPDRERT